MPILPLFPINFKRIMEAQKQKEAAKKEAENKKAATAMGADGSGQVDVSKYKKAEQPQEYKPNKKTSSSSGSSSKTRTPVSKAIGTTSAGQVRRTSSRGYTSAPVEKQKAEVKKEPVYKPVEPEKKQTEWKTFSTSMMQEHRKSEQYQKGESPIKEIPVFYTEKKVRRSRGFADILYPISASLGIGAQYDTVREYNFYKTKQDVVQETYDLYQKQQKNVNEATTVKGQLEKNQYYDTKTGEIKTIDPSKEYTYTDPQGQQVKAKGSTIINKYIQPQIKKVDTYLQGKPGKPGARETEEKARQAWVKAQDLPPGTKAAGSLSTGYVFDTSKHDKKQAWEAVKKEGVLGLFATALTPTDPLGLRSAYYVATGDKQRARDVKAEAVIQTKQLKQEGLIGFGKFWFGSPITQIALAATAGTAVGAGGAYAGGYTAVASSPATITAGKVGMAAAGTTMIGYTAYDAYQTSKTDPGMATAKIGVGILSAAAGYAGYRYGSQYVTKSGLTFGERGARRGYEAYLNKMQHRSITKYGGDTVIKADGKLLRNPSPEMERALIGYRKDYNLKFKYKAISPARAGIQRSYSTDYYAGLGAYRNVNTKIWQADLIKKQGGYKGVWEKIYGSKQKSDTAYNYFSRAKSGLFKKKTPEMMGGQTYKLGTKDIDLNTAYGRYVMDMLQLEKKHPGLLNKLDIKSSITKGKRITTTGYNQPTPHEIGGFRTAPLIKSAATTGEPGFGLPAPQGAKSISSAANIYARIHYIKTGKFPGSNTPAGSFIQSAAKVEPQPIIQSSSRIKYIFEHETLGQKLLPVISKGYAKIPTGMQSQFYKFNMGAYPGSVTATGTPGGGIPTFTPVSSASSISPFSFSFSPSFKSRSSGSSISSSSSMSSISSSSSMSSISSSSSISSGSSISSSILSSALSGGSSLSSIGSISSGSSLSSMSSISSSSSSSSSSSASSLSSGGMGGFIPFMPMGVFGGGGAGGKFTHWSKIKKYRGRKTIDPFAGLKVPKDLWGF